MTTVVPTFSTSNKVTITITDNRTPVIQNFSFSKIVNQKFQTAPIDLNKQFFFKVLDYM